MSLRIPRRMGAGTEPTIVGGPWSADRALVHAVCSSSPGAPRIGALAVAMLIVAEGAVWLLRPGETPPEPAPVTESDYFNPAQVERAHDYREGQRLLIDRRHRRRGRAAGGAGAGQSAVRPPWPRPPRQAPGARRRRGRRRALADGGAWRRSRPRSGRTSARSTSGSRRSRSGPGSPTSASRRRSAPCSTAVGATILLAIVRRFGRSWWIPAAPPWSRSPPSSPGWRRWSWRRSSTASSPLPDGQRPARRGARARGPGRGRHRGGLPRRCEPALDRAQRLRRTGSARPSGWCSTTT